MAHVGEKAAFRLVGLLGLHLFCFEFLGTFLYLLFQPDSVLFGFLKATVGGGDGEQNQRRKRSQLHAPVGNHVTRRQAHGLERKRDHAKEKQRECHHEELGRPVFLGAAVNAHEQPDQRENHRQNGANLNTQRVGYGQGQRNAAQAHPAGHGEYFIRPRVSRGRIQIYSAPLDNRKVRRKDEHRNVHVGPPDPCGPQVLKRQTVDAHLRQTPGAEEQHVEQVAAVAEKYELQRAVDQHDQQSPVVDSEQELLLDNELEERVGPPELDGQAHGTARFNAQQMRLMGTCLYR